MDINIALDNFKQAYNDLIGAIEGEEPGLKTFAISSDIGGKIIRAKNSDHAISLFRVRYGYNYIKIHSVNELQTNVDNGLHK